MKRIEVRLSLTAVAPLLDVVREVADELEGNLAAPMSIADLDGEMAAAWLAGLNESQHSDLGLLLGLFGEEFFQDGSIALDEENAEAVLRACSAVRLRLRSERLDDLGEEALESGEVDLESLPGASRRTFLCYLFLATLQEIVIRHLVSDATEE